MNAAIASAARGSFTVVTPNFNTARYLGRTIESVLRNLRPGDQYFIIDGGSTDGSVEIIRSYAKDLTGWVSEPDRGYADAIAKGFARSGGEYMCWLNSSDVLLDGALDEARRRLSAGNADLIFGDDYYIDDADRVIFRAHGRTHSLRHMMLYGGWTPLQDACFWKRSLYDAVGGLDPRLTHAADFDLFLRMSLAGRCVYVPVVFSAFRRHAGQKSIDERTDYGRERERCRIAALDARRDPWVRRRLLAIFYWIAVRVRARALRHLRLESRRHAGESVLRLACQASG